MDTGGEGMAVTVGEVLAWSGRAKAAEGALALSESRRRALERSTADLESRFKQLRSGLLRLASEMEKPGLSAEEYDLGLDAACELYAADIRKLLDATAGLGLEDAGYVRRPGSAPAEGAGK